MIRKLDFAQPCNGTRRRAAGSAVEHDCGDWALASPEVEPGRENDHRGILDSHSASCSSASSCSSPRSRPIFTVTAPSMCRSQFGVGGGVWFSVSSSFMASKERPRRKSRVTGPTEGGRICAFRPPATLDRSCRKGQGVEVCKTFLGPHGFWDLPPVPLVRCPTGLGRDRIGPWLSMLPIGVVRESAANVGAEKDGGYYCASPLKLRPPFQCSGSLLYASWPVSLLPLGGAGSLNWFEHPGASNHPNNALAHSDA